MCYVFWKKITKWADDGSPVDVIYLDFQKAFDQVPHQRRISKLKSHGMGNSNNQLDRTMANGQDTKGGCGRRGF